MDDVQMETATSLKGGRPTLLKVFYNVFFLFLFRMPHFNPALDLTRYRSSHLQSQRELLRSPMNNQRQGSSDELILGEFRRLSNSQTYDSFDHSDKDYLLKKRTL